jgi:hypothetical protein
VRRGGGRPWIEPSAAHRPGNFGCGPAVKCRSAACAGVAVASGADSPGYRPDAVWVLMSYHDVQPPDLFPTLSRGKHRNPHGGRRPPPLPSRPARLDHTKPGADRRLTPPTQPGPRRPAMRYAGCSTRAPAARIAASARSPSPGCRSTARTSPPRTTVSNPNRTASGWRRRRPPARPSGRAGRRRARARSGRATATWSSRGPPPDEPRRAAPRRSGSVRRARRTGRVAGGLAVARGACQ